MKRKCPYCEPQDSVSGSSNLVIRSGRFYRKSDSRRVQRFRCLSCKKQFSSATNHPCAYQKKRQFNHKLMEMFVSGVSIRRASRLLGLHRTTVARKLVFLGEQAKFELRRHNLSQTPSKIIEFDDLETFEHTKCKPLSVTLAVEHKTRRVLDFQVSRMPAKGKLSAISRKKYGLRKDERYQGRKALFTNLKDLVEPNALIKSDENPHYIQSVKEHFPNAFHERHKGQRGSIVGQGELKKVRFDPLFSLNHTCAMMRANINRLFRRTWCTTKLPERLSFHIAIYALYHNLVLLE